MLPIINEMFLISKKKVVHLFLEHFDGNRLTSAQALGNDGKRSSADFFVEDQIIGVDLVQVRVGEGGSLFGLILQRISSGGNR